MRTRFSSTRYSIAADDGKLNLSLPLGEYVLVALTEQGRCGKAEFAVVDGVPGNAELRVVLRHAWSAKGVTVEFHATPPPGTSPAKISIGVGALAPGAPRPELLGRWDVQPDANGAFVLKGRLSPGDYEAAAIDPAKGFARIKFTVMADQPATVKVQLAKRR
ncbi:MAG: hypothetical protein GY720_15540 [bacterium]|nr:hypothetical protein [bacterium]